MLSAEEIMQLVKSLIWLLAGVGIFIVGMNFLSEALEKYPCSLKMTQCHFK